MVVPSERPRGLVASSERHLVSHGRARCFSDFGFMSCGFAVYFESGGLKIQSRESKVETTKSRDCDVE